MKCSDVGKLLVSQRMTESDRAALRRHAAECTRCAAEIEALLAAMTLDNLSLDKPSSFFADNVMARVEVLPVPRRVPTRHLITFVSFIAAVSGLAVLLPIISRAVVGAIAGSVHVEGFASLVEDIASAWARVSEIVAIWAPELLNATRGSVGANLATVSILLCVLTAILYTAKPAKTNANWLGE